MKRLPVFLAAFLASASAYSQTPGAASIATGQVSVGTGATLIAAARSGGFGISRISITVVNGGQAIALCVGAASTVTAANGICLPAVAGASITLNTTAALYGIWSDGSTHSVSFIETF